MPEARFEHVAIAVHEQDLLGWDRFLRGDLGGSASLGGAERRAGFQGGQVTYPGGGMIEMLSWLPGAEEGSAMKRYLDRHGGRAAVHHLTFLVDDLDASLDRARALQIEPMVGRRSAEWNEYFVREPALRPAGLLVQVLQADKGALLDAGWSKGWAPFRVEHAAAAPPVRVAGVRLGCTDVPVAARLFTELLGAEIGADSATELRFFGSSMGLWLEEGSDDARVDVQRDRAADFRPAKRPPLADVLVRELA